MEFNQKSSQPVLMVVRASNKSIKSNYTKKSPRYKRDPDLEVLPSAVDYYSSELKKFHQTGKQATAVCPFHNDRNPSFSVNLKNGAFFCFACGARGTSIVGFYAKKHRLSFSDACKALGVSHE